MIDCKIRQWMFLFHGTSEENFKKILKDRKIKNSSIKINKNTAILNNVFGRILEEDIRKDVVYLVKDRHLNRTYSKGFLIPLTDLDMSNLYVADLDIAHRIFEDYDNGRNVEDLVFKYADSIKKFANCKEKNLEGNKEFLYFGEIYVDESYIVA